MKILGIIPARYGSTRFPGKPLIDINGKSMIQRVYEQAKSCPRLDNVFVATDDQRIFDHVKSFGGSVEMTSDKHESGTDRCAEALDLYEKESGKTFHFVINVFLSALESSSLPRFDSSFLMSSLLSLYCWNWNLLPDSD
jgi:3-deoxy-manno-octulosonate cytidylyltransferase (CMP-KDO synthetase)